MVSFCFKTNNKNIIEYLMDNISLINSDNIVYVNKQFCHYDNVIVHFTGSNISEFYNEIASIIANSILQFYEPEIVHNLILVDYFYFDDIDMDKIEKNANIILSDTSTMEFTDRKKLLWTDVLRYISSNKSMVLDGFVRFRVSDYIKNVNYAIDFAVNQFIINREYFEFIDLLKEYIDSRESTTSLVHLIYIQGDPILLDENKNIILLDDSSLNKKFLSDITFSSNDYILNSLLTLIPKKIIIHQISNEDDFIDTVKLIFGESVSICTDCDICKTYKLLYNYH